MFLPLIFQEVDCLWRLEEDLSFSKHYQFVHVVGGYYLLSGLFSCQFVRWPECWVNHLVSACSA